MRYDAFISYRHAPLDMEVAKRIHTGLETYKIPASVQKKTGKKKMGRAFRDQEELPIGSDLDDNISGALAESKYLIVICSPRTPESYWVCKEIENFIKMHDRNHVLAVLIEGEPSESFPPQLLTDEEGNPVEPLAADVRGADKKERNSKYKTELLRLAAPVIGCTYDELRQRHRERMIRKTITLASSAAAVIAVSGMAFGIYNAGVASKMKQLADEKSRLADEITVQYKGKQENQSRFYAEESLSLFDQGNREDAVLVAMEGLPSEENDRPYVPEAEYALSKALYAYDSGNDLSFDRNLTHSLPLAFMKRSDDARLLVTFDKGNKVYVWDTENWTLKTTIEPSVNEFNYYENVNTADADASGVYINTDYALTKYDYDGNVIYSKETDDMVVECEVCEDSNKVILVCHNSISILDAGSGEVQKTIEESTGITFKKGGKYIADKGIYAAQHYSDDENADNYFSLINIGDGTKTDTKLSEGFSLDFGITDNGNYAVLSCNGDILHNGLTHTVLDLIDKNGNLVWSRDLDADASNILSFVAIVKAHQYEKDGVTNSDIVVTVESDAFTIDESTGEIKAEFNLPGDATMLALSVGVPYGRVGYNQGNIDFVDFSTGKIHSEFSFETNASVREAVVLQHGLAFNSFSSPDVHVLSWHEAPDAKEFMAFNDDMKVFSVSDDSKYLAMGASREYGKVSIYDREGNVIYSYDQGDSIKNVVFRGNAAFIYDSGIIVKINLTSKSAEEYRLQDYDFDINFFDVNLSADGNTAAIWSGRKLLMLDLVKKEKLALIETENQIGAAIPAADKNTVYIIEGGKTLYKTEIATGENTILGDDNLRMVINSSNMNYMTLSPDGKYLAITCMDGNVRIVDIKSLATVEVIPMDAYYQAYVSFTSDNKHLVMQGDDYKVRIWDMDSREIVNSVDTGVKVRCIVCDEDSKLMAVCSGYGMLLYETDTYGCVADIDRGMAYFSDDDSILISSDRMDLKCTQYKNYKQLIEEAKKQFAGAVLSAEKKVKYNIN
ncbi:toll/interleukin-1 receptor domain-containing protein [Butyrivibrio sp. WCE2006]|uniref:toll/interleukin-1 receptor domain-containing protein n=1 Tax=Butyrivibrio sp. WCE2006 TaxID=1410611 RepID=UPI0005D26682|nr:TIR domain-containing protein [Butyrivibrio sp. WCE2006]